MTGTESWVEEAISEAEQMKVDELKSNLDIGAIITSDKKSETVVEINGVKIKIKSFISKPLRRKLIRAQHITESSDVNEVETTLYETLSELCLEKPYNDPFTWKYLDDNGADVNNCISIIMKAVAEVSKKTRDFRPK